jgi:hypothetical protein
MTSPWQRHSAHSCLPSRVSPVASVAGSSQVAGTDPGGVVVLDVDVILVTSHSQKESATATFKNVTQIVATPRQAF